MKRLLFLLVFITTVQVATTNAQTFKYGIRGGVSTPDIKPSDVDSLRFKRGLDSLKLKVSDANYGFHFGIWARLKLGKFYLQPEVVFNSSKVQYKIGKLGSSVDSIKNETFNNLDIPVMLGTKVGSFRLNAGPVAHIRLGGSSDLVKTSGFTQTFKTATWGYQAGIGFDAGRVGIDLRYEGNFDKFGNQLMLGGKAYPFSKAPTRFTATASIAF